MNETYRSLCRMRIAFAKERLEQFELDSDSVNPFCTMEKYSKLTDFWNNVKTYWENKLKYNLYHTGK